jgi:hypothetical protein
MKHTDVFSIQDVPEEERRARARQVADGIIKALRVQSA